MNTTEYRPPTRHEPTNAPAGLDVGTRLAFVFLMATFALAGIAVDVAAGMHDMEVGVRAIALAIGTLLAAGAVALAVHVGVTPVEDRRTRPARDISRPRSDEYSSLAISAFFAAFVAAVPGIVLGHLALRDVARTGKRGHGLAIAALAISYSLLAAGIALWIVILVIATK